MGTIESKLPFSFRIRISIRNELDIHTVVNSRVMVQYSKIYAMIASHVNTVSLRKDAKLKGILGFFFPVNLQAETCRMSMHPLANSSGCRPQCMQECQMRSDLSSENVVSNTLSLV